ncbi:unnamed protein product [Cuscuta europaea]|uniref:Pectinesterase catalytic domain-containing protein n=1 Tax=Cuscuta europaea TaxID=41803 RepID=A0A9P0YNK8_CUSEU|nr:unnamed protein product [Cuscuta europaea]
MVDESGSDFIAEGITFRNTVGPQHRAVALLVQGDRSVFYRCSVEGYKDTLSPLQGILFFRECYIYGTADFVFCNARAVFQNCILYARNPIAGEDVTLTAQGRVITDLRGGFVFQNCQIRATPDLMRPSTKVFLGRPWTDCSRVLFMQSRMESIIDPTGWREWGEGSNASSSTCLYYGEYRNTRPGASTNRRVDWPGYHKITRASEAILFTVQNFINGTTWLPGTNVPFKLSRS